MTDQIEQEARDGGQKFQKGASATRYGLGVMFTATLSRAPGSERAMPDEAASDRERRVGDERTQQRLS